MRNRVAEYGRESTLSRASDTVLLSTAFRWSAKPCATLRGLAMAVSGGGLNETAFADTNEPSQRERLRMVPVDLTGVDLTNELIERQADASANLTLQEVVVLALVHVQDGSACRGVCGFHRDRLAQQDGIGVRRISVKERWAAMRAGAPDLRTEVLDVIAEGDRVAIRSRLSNGSGELFELLRINKGQIAELWGARTS